MKTLPTLDTERLILRPFTLRDAPRVRELAGAREIAANTLTMPHPYEEGMAEEWIGMHEENFQSGQSAEFAICLRDSGELIGAIGLKITQEHDCGEIGYWIGIPFWNQGFCTEAAAAVIAYGFDGFDLNRIGAIHFSRNPASGRVMQKIGMRYEGESRQAMKRWDEYVDITRYGILREDFEKTNPAA